MTGERIGLISSAVPLLFGGARFIVDWLEAALRERGHAVERLFIPTTSEPDQVLSQMAAFRMMDLERYFDRVITFRPPSHHVRHPRKVCWFIHHERIFYDLWDTEYRPVPDTAAGRALRNAIRHADGVALGEAHRLFTNSRIVAQRVREYNGLGAEVLYPPVFQPERFRDDGFGDEIVCICRMEAHKRQHLLVEAMAHVRSGVRLRLCGTSSNPAYFERLEGLVRRHGVADRVVIDHRWISEEKKVELLATCLASAYIPFDEDSYGYPTLEAAYARRPTVTVTDSGGVPEFISNGVNGLITPPTPPDVAKAFDQLFRDRDATKLMGAAAERRVAELGIDWDTVVGKLLA